MRPGREGFQLSRLQRELPTLGNTSASHDLQACTRSQSTIEGNERVLDAWHPKETPRHSYPVNNSGEGEGKTLPTPLHEINNWSQAQISCSHFRLLEERSASCCS